MTNAQSPMNDQCPMTNVMTGGPRESGAQEQQRHRPAGRPRPASSATVPQSVAIGRQGGSIQFVNGRGGTHGLVRDTLDGSLISTLNLGGAPFRFQPTNTQPKDCCHDDSTRCPEKNRPFDRGHGCGRVASFLVGASGP